jgi:alkanesulfonate monooxygenase SsuD/methylene tetrahydromethanopterin reductase-like flavin-dependent oxidoreductase (luciferase family)
MQVGVYADFRNPPGWQQPWASHYRQVMDRLVEAERLGVDSVWLSEHHSFEDGYLPQPLTIAAALAARTSRVRIGTAVLLAPLRPALDIAEQAALVDILSDGRVELGLGVGYRAPEFEAFGEPMSRRYPLFEERAQDVRRMWEDGRCMPPPVQKRVPIWLGGMGPRVARLAGRLGEGLLWLDRGLLAPYREGLEEGGHNPATARMSGVVTLVLADDPEAAWAAIRPHYQYQRESYARYAAEGAARGSKRPPTVQAGSVDPDSMRGPADQSLPPTFDVVTPDEAAARLRPWLETLPVEHIFLWESIAEMPSALAERHIELVATRLRPALADIGRSD